MPQHITQTEDSRRGRAVSLYKVGPEKFSYNNYYIRRRIPHPYKVLYLQEVQYPPLNCLQCLVAPYPASRGPSIFLDKSGRGRDLCQPPRLSLICRSSTETDESVRFETCFSRFCSVRKCLVRNCWLNTRPRYVGCAREVHSSGRFSFERCLR